MQFAPRAKDATLAEQTIVAERAYAANGLNDWNASKRCWGGKVDTSAPARVAAPQPSGRHASGQPAPATTRKAAPPRHAAPAPAPAVVDPAHRYTVRPGDTLSGISVAHGGQDWHAVYKRNRAVVGDNPHLIFPGEVLDV
jgi:nucleoid-associated protein YgaU